MDAILGPAVGIGTEVVGPDLYLEISGKTTKERMILIGINKFIAEAFAKGVLPPVGHPSTESHIKNLVRASIDHGEIDLVKELDEIEQMVSGLAARSRIGSLKQKIKENSGIED